MTAPDRWISTSTDYATARPQGSGDAWREEAARQGRQGTHRLLEVAEVVPPADVAEALGLHPGESAVVRRRLVLLDDQPVELADSYYSMAIARGTALIEPGKIRGGAITLLAELGHGIARLQEDVSVRMPTENERELLALGDDQPVMVLLRLSTDVEGAAVEVTMMVIADGRSLRYELAV